MKGYTYQQHVFAMFLALMDTERQISKIEVESLDTKNFDDMYMETVGENKSSYRVQIKNYPDTLIGDIKIENSKVIIKDNVNEYDDSDRNLFIVNTDKIVTDDKFMELSCIRINDIVIIPLTVDTIMDLMDAMFEEPEREIQIYHLAEAKTEKAIFQVTIDELPELIQLSSDLDNHTVLLRKVPDELKKGITYIEGKPGVGKSHYVTEICNKFPEAIVYRFWVDSQDINRNLRLQYSTFIKELGIKVYGTPKKVHENELIAKVSKGNYIAYWFNLIGNIPLLLYKYQIDIHWGKMYKIFNDILDLSLVYRGDKRTDK